MSIAELSILDRVRAKSTSQWIPLQASLELTNRCNERCTHCYIDKFQDDPRRVLELDGWYRVLQELREAGSLYVILMGGEAMLNPHFWEIAERAVKLGFHTSMISNGLKIRDRKTAQRLADLGIANITFSFYSMSREIHEGMTRVKGSHKRTLDAIEWSLDAGIDVSMNCLLTSANIGGAFEVQDWCLARGIQLKVDPMVTPKLNGDITPTSLRPSESQLYQFYKEQTRRWPASRPRPSIEMSSSYVCNAAKGKCAVNAYGELLPCIEIRESLGNLTKESFEEIWHSPSVAKWRTMLVGDLKNYPRNGDESFCDHCPGMAKNEDQDPYQVSKYAQSLAKIKNKVRREVINAL